MSQVSTTKRSVLDERFLKCGVCNERFWDNSKLIKHMESHEEAKLLLCTICNKTFQRVQDLDKHYLLHRQLLQPYGCPACESRFETQQQLMVHVDNIHPELTIGSKQETSKPTGTKIKIVNVDSVQKSTGLRSKAGSMVKKGSVINIQLPLPASKKSILKTAPTPVGKKRPVVWKEPVVSPEKSLKRDLSLQVVGKKRELLIMPQDAGNAKRLKTATTQSMPAVQNLNVGVSKQSTLTRSTPVAKTKLMQNISQIYDKQTPKSMADTRKGLLNSLQIIPLSQGPIRVSKVTKQPFIVYSPSKGNPIQMGNLSSGPQNTKVSTPSVKPQSASGTIADFDAVRLFSTSKLSPSLTIKIADKSKEASGFDSLTKNVVAQSKSPPVPPKVLFPIQTTPLSGIQKNVKGAQLVKIQKILPMAGSAAQKNTVTISPVLSVNRSPQISSPVNRPKVQIITLSPAKKVESSQVQNLSTDKNLPKFVGAKVSRGQKTVTNPKSGTSIVDKSDAGSQLISEKEVVRDPEVKFQKFNLLLPTIQLTRLSENDIQKNKKTQKSQAPGNSSSKVPAKSTRRSSREVQLKSKSPEKKGVKIDKSSRLVKKNAEQPVKRSGRIKGKINATVEESNLNTEEESRPQEIVVSDEVKKVQQQSKIIGTRAATGSKLGIMFQPTTNVMKKVKANMVKDQAKISEDKQKLNLAEKSDAKTPSKVYNTSVATEQPKWKSTEKSEIKNYGKPENSLSEDDSPEAGGSKKLVVRQSPTVIGVKQQEVVQTTVMKSKETRLPKSNIKRKEEIQSSTTKNPLQGPAKTDSVKLQSVTQQPKRSARNAARTRAKLLEQQSCDEITKDDNKNTKEPAVKALDIGKESKKSMQVSKPEIVMPVADIEPVARRSKRTLKRIYSKEDAPIPQKKAKMAKKQAIKKEILRQVIEKQVEEIEKEEEQGSSAVSENVNSSNAKNPSLLPPNLLKTPLQNNVRIVTLTPEAMRKLKETVLKNTSSTTPNHIRLVVPPEVISKIQNTATKDQNSGAGTSSTPDVTVPQVIRYNMEDMKRLQEQRKEERAKNAEKEKIMKKMLEKFDEKEMKKQVKFCEKKLLRFISRHQQSHLEGLKERVLNVRNLSPESGNRLFRDVLGVSCKECKEVIGGTLCSLGFGDERELLEEKVMQGFIALSTSKVRKKRSPNKPMKKAPPPKKPVTKVQKVVSTPQTTVQKSTRGRPKKPVMKVQQVVSTPVTSVQKLKKEVQGPPKSTFSVIECSPNKGAISYLNGGVKSYDPSKVPVKINVPTAKRKRNVKKKDPAPVFGDPFADVSIVTEEKFVLECSCGKPSCDGLHPENFFV